MQWKGLSIMHGSIIRILFIRVIFQSNIANTVLIVKPQNTAVFVGVKVTLPCVTDENKKLSWDGKTNGSFAKQIFTGAHVIDKEKKNFKITNNETGKFDLEMIASANTARLFGCFEPGNGTTETAEVIAIESTLTCSFDNAYSSSDETYICSVTYFGNWAPQIRWKENGETVPKSRTPNSINGHKVSSVLEVTHVSIFDVTCYIEFTNENYKGSSTAKNIPDFNYSSSCPIESVRFISSSANRQFQTTSLSPHHSWNIGKIIECLVVPVVIVVLMALVVVCRIVQGRSPNDNTPRFESGIPGTRENESSFELSENLTKNSSTEDFTSSDCSDGTNPGTLN